VVNIKLVLNANFKFSSVFNSTSAIFKKRPLACICHKNNIFQLKVEGLADACSLLGGPLIITLFGMSPLEIKNEIFVSRILIHPHINLYLPHIGWKVLIRSYLFLLKSFSGFFLFYGGQHSY
jgi:hypothetical protein